MRLPRGVVRAAVLAGSRPLGPPVPIAVQRRLLAVSARLGRTPAGTQVEPLTLAGRPAERVTCGPVAQRTVLLLHGGAFITCSPRTHRVFAAHLSRAAQAPVVVLDYRLAPEHPYPAAVDDADAALDALLAHGAVDVVGDSAGGALALLLALRRRDSGRLLPGAVGLVSPVVDLTAETASGWRGSDPVLREGWVREGCAAFVGGADARALSPLHQRLHDLPPVLVQVSEHERLWPEGEQLVERLQAFGAPVESELLAGLWHDAHLQADLVPEAAAAVTRLGQFLRQHS